jgi:hypothetical protein
MSAGIVGVLAVMSSDAAVSHFVVCVMSMISGYILCKYIVSF